MKRHRKWFRGKRPLRIVRVIRESENLAFTRASIYRGELERVLREIAANPTRETGGELFGFYRDDGSPVVCYALGPGANANRQYAFFNQDLDYLLKAGKALCEQHGLEHIGEWHSHHRLGLDHPSGHDAETVASGVRARGRRRFLLGVGTIAGNRVSLGGFAFTGGTGTVYSRVNWQIVDGDSPFRTAVGEI